MTKPPSSTKCFSDLRFLFLEQMLEVRAAWLWYVIFSFIFPIIVVFAIGHIGSGLTDRTSLLFIVSGAAIITVTNEALVNIAIRVAAMRKEGILLYYASLPISKTAFILAVLLSRLVISLPGMIIAVFLGPRLYNISFEFSLWIVVLLPLTALSLSAIGVAASLLIESLE